MKLICMHCGKEFEGDNEKFCHNSCRDAYIVSIDKRAREAVNRDPSHVEKLK